MNYGDFFYALKATLNGFINIIYQALNVIPWWLFILLVILLTRKLLGSYRKGFMYGALLFCVGTFGYWEMMNETLSIVITSVIFFFLFFE